MNKATHRHTKKQEGDQVATADVATEDYDPVQEAAIEILGQSAVITMIRQALKALIPDLQGAHETERIQKAVQALSSVEKKLDQIALMIMPEDELFQIAKEMTSTVNKTDYRNK